MVDMVSADDREEHPVKGLKRKLFGTRRRSVFTVLGLMLLSSAGTALAAFIIYSGVGGSAGGQYTTTTSTVAAISVSSTANPTLVPGAAAVPFPLTFTNMDSGAPHGITANSLDAVVSSSIPACAAYISLNGTFGALVGSGVPSIAAGGTNTTAGAGVTIVASNAAPVSCAGATFSLAFSGTST